jgi:hypothetical protein
MNLEGCKMREMAEYLKFLLCAIERNKVIRTHRINLWSHSRVAIFLHCKIKALR